MNPVVCRKLLLGFGLLASSNLSALEFELSSGFPEDVQNAWPRVVSGDGSVMGGMVTIGQPGGSDRDGFIWRDGKVEFLGQTDSFGVSFMSGDGSRFATGHISNRFGGTLLYWSPDEEGIAFGEQAGGYDASLLLGLASDGQSAVGQRRPAAGGAPEGWWWRLETGVESLPAKFIPSFATSQGILYGQLAQTAKATIALARSDSGGDPEILAEDLVGTLRVLAVSADGRRVSGEFADAGGERVRPFEWSRLTGFRLMTAQPILPGKVALSVDGMSADGHLVVGVADDYWGDDDCITFETPFLAVWNGDKLQVWTIAELAATAGFTEQGWHFGGPLAISADGSTVVGLASRLIDDEGNCRKTPWRLTGVREALGDAQAGRTHRLKGLGWIDDHFWPWIWSWSFNEWLYVQPDSSYASVWAYRSNAAEWIWMNQDWGAWYWRANAGEWLTIGA